MNNGILNFVYNTDLKDACEFFIRYLILLYDNKDPQKNIKALKIIKNI